MPATQLLNAVVPLIHILSLNIWGLPDVGFRVLSPYRTERVAAICEKFKDSAARSDGWDVILLQEVWVGDDRETLKKCGYAYSADREDSKRMIDSGLMILSRYPLKNAQRLIYPSKADESSILADGEGLARKSALSAWVQDPAGEYEVSDTHLISFYDENDYHEIRQAQFNEMMDWVTMAGQSSSLIVGGDFNLGKDSPLWGDVQKRLGTFSTAPSSDSACTVCPPNLMHIKNEGKIDHLFGSPAFIATSGGPVLGEALQIDGLTMNVSDHFGWETVFQRK